MDKIFTPNKWFVLFCALFIAIFATLKWVVNTRLETTAKSFGEDIYSWVWLDKNVCSSADMTDAKILHSNGNDAVVEVSGEQTFGPFDSSKPCSIQSGKSQCKAILTFYHLQNDWKLGRVEFE